MASIVIIAPLMAKVFNSSGIAVISLLFSSTAICPRVSPLAQEYALTICNALKPLLLLRDPRTVFPSMGITFSGNKVFSLLIVNCNYLLTPYCNYLLTP
jgi:hypothetical protein